MSQVSFKKLKNHLLNEGIDEKLLYITNVIIGEIEQYTAHFHLFHGATQNNLLVLAKEYSPAFNRQEGITKAFIETIFSSPLFFLIE